MAEAEIVSKRDTQSLDLRRSGKMDVEISYTIDGQGPFFLYFPEEEYTAEKARQAVEKKRREWEEVVGKKLGSSKIGSQG